MSATKSQPELNKRNILIDFGFVLLDAARPARVDVEGITMSYRGSSGQAKGGGLAMQPQRALRPKLLSFEGLLGGGG